MHVWKPLNFVQYRHLQDLICEQSWTSIRCQGFLKDYVFVASINIWQFFITAWCHQVELFAQSFVDFDIGLCLGSSASSSLVSLFRTVRSVSYCQRWHRTLSGVVGVFVAGVAILNFSLNCYRHHRHRTLPEDVYVFIDGVIILNFLPI